MCITLPTYYYLNITWFVLTYHLCIILHAYLYILTRRQSSDENGGTDENRTPDEDLHDQVVDDVPPPPSPPCTCGKDLELPPTPPMEGHETPFMSGKTYTSFSMTFLGFYQANSRSLPKTHMNVAHIFNV